MLGEFAHIIAEKELASAKREGKGKSLRSFRKLRPKVLEADRERERGKERQREKERERKRVILLLVAGMQVLGYTGRNRDAGYLASS